MKRKTFKKLISFLLIAVVTFLVLYFSLKDDYKNILYEINNINKLWLLVAFLLMFLYWVLKALVRKKLVSKFNKKYSYLDSLKLSLELNFFNGVTPFATGGQPYEVYSLIKNKIKGTDATNIMIQNFITYQIALVFLGTLAMITNKFLHIFPNGFLTNLITIGFSINLFVIVVLFVITFCKKIDKFVMKIIVFILSKFKVVKDTDSTIQKFQKYLEEFHEGATILLKDKKNFICMILLQLVALSTLYLIPLMLLYGMGDYTSLNCYKTIIISAYVMLIGSFVPIPGGTGGLEYGFVAFYGNFIKGSKLNATMLLWRFITYYFGIFLGAIVLNFRRKKR